MSREERIAAVAAALLRGLFWTLRLEARDEHRFLENVPPGPFLVAFWHNRILAITVVFQRLYPRGRKGVTVLTSPSRDGEILAQVAARFGMGAVRGSSSRRGAAALRECLEELRRGRDLAITPDGPRGPRYRLGPGLILLAQQTSAPILPLHADFSAAIRLKTWDKFYLPLPFSKIRLKILPLQWLEPTADDGEFEQQRRRVEELLHPRNHRQPGARVLQQWTFLS